MHKLLSTVLSLLLLNICLAQSPTSIQLNKIYDLSLAKNSSIQYEITIPQTFRTGLNLYISGYSIINDPLQQPKLKIKSGLYQLKCQQQSSNLNQVCFVPTDKLSIGQKLVIQASCQINCQAKLVTYLSKTVQLDLGQQIYVQTQDSPVQSIFKINMPKSLNYTNIQLVLNIQNVNPFQTAQMYIKCSQNQVYPSKQNHDAVNIFNWNQNKMGVLNKKVNILQGQDIYVQLVLGSHITVKFQSRIGNNDNHYLQLNQVYEDYIYPPNVNRIYILDLTYLNTTNYDMPIIVQIKQYSGSPKIQVSLNQYFTINQLIKPSTTSSWIRFELTPLMFKSSAYQQKIYVRVSSQSGASYAVMSRFKVSQLDSIRQGMSEYIQVKGNQAGTLVYRFDIQQQDNNNTREVRINIQNQADNIYILKVYMCNDHNTYNCKYNNNNGQLPLTFKQLTYHTTNSDIQIQYQSDNCVKNTGLGQGSIDQLLCTMIFVITNKYNNNNKLGKYAITILQPKLLFTLSQGQSYIGNINKQQYKYFTYYLPSIKIQNHQILQLIFYVNTLDGYVQLFSSRDIINPGIKDNNNPHVKTGVQSIIYGPSQIGVGNYYFSVYGIYSSDYVVNVVLRKRQISGQTYIRKNVNDVLKQSITTTNILLKDGLAQTYQLYPGSYKIGYKINTVGNGNITLVVTELIGSVSTFVTRDKNKTREECVNNYCVINNQYGETFFIEVIGNDGTYRKFTIVYKQIKECYKFPVGTPIYVQLDPSPDTECVQFTIQPTFAHQISHSLNNLQLLNHDTQVILQFQPNTTLVMSTNTFLLQSTDLSKYCPTSTRSCLLTVRFISKSKQNNINLQFIIQKLDGIITLYDGIVQRMDTIISNQDMKYFRFPINIQQSVQIFINSDTASDYIITATLLENTQSSNIAKYPKYGGSSATQWRVNSSPDSPSLTMLPISKFKLKNAALSKNLKSPWLVICVYGPSTEQNQHVIFTIDITQNQRILRQGQQHIGFIQPQQIVTYQIYPTTLSLLSIRSYQNAKCYTLLDQNKQTITQQDIYIQKPRDIPLTYYIQSSPTTNCIYQISLQDYQNSILSITQGFPTKVILQYSQTSYFLYYHNQNVTFRVYQFITSGSSSLYVTPYNTTQTKGIKQIIDNIRLSSFQYKTNMINNIQINAQVNSTSYCYNCYYIIAIHGQPAVHEDIVVVKDSTPVMIKDHTIIDTYLNKGQKQQFVYYSGSLSKFNLSIDVVYGYITVIVKSYQKSIQGEIVRIQSIAKSMINLPIVQKIQLTKLQMATDYLNKQNKYKIFVQGIQNSLYHLQIVKYQQTFKIVQGVSSKMKVPASGFINLQFDNLIEQDNIQLNVQTTFFDLNPIIVDVYFRYPGQTINQNIKISANYMHIGRVTFVYFASLRGHYTIKLMNNLFTPFDIVAEILRPGITELREMHQFVSQKQNIFQVYVQEGSYAVIQVFACAGNLKVRGSDDYNALKRSTPRSKQIQLLHQNIGGHYVITTPINKTGQYFLRIQNKQYTASISQQVSGLVYMIRHRIINTTNKNPYEVLDAQSYKIQIQPIQDKQNVTIKLNKIKSLSQTIKIKSIRYIITIGKSADDVQNYMICQTTRDTKHLTITQDKQHQQDIIQLNISKLEVLKRVGVNTNAYIGAIALVLIQYGDKQMSGDFVFVYEPSFMGQLKSKKVITVSGFFEIMVIVCTIIGGIVIVYALGVHALKIYRGYNNTNQLVQQQSGQQNKNHQGSSDFQISHKQQSQAPSINEQKTN